MTQNVYDNAEFFAGYSQLQRSIHGLDGAPEWSVLRGMLPDLHKLAVVDLGCGFGWFCRWARQNGAAQVLGLDISENMLARAQGATSDSAISYCRTDLEGFDLPAVSFGLAYSSLALHYLENLDRLLATVHAALIPGGSFVFSVEHPIYTAPSNPEWVSDAQGHQTWALDAYLVEGQRTTDWLTKGVIKQHRTLAHYCNKLLRHGFTLCRVEEWGPDDAQIAADPSLVYARHRPPFLLVSARA